MATAPLIRILLADDHQIVRAGLAQFIADQGDLQVTAEAGTGDEVIDLVRKQEFDVLLLDISMPEKTASIPCASSASRGRRWRY